MAYLHDPEDHEEIGHGAALQAVWERRARQERADAQQAALPVQRLRPELHRYAPTGQETHGIERDNARQRHWLARFRRRSIVVSKAKRMVDVSIALFARFAGNAKI